MSLDPEDYSLLQGIAEAQREQRDILNHILEIKRVQARQEFLLLTMSPAEVRNQLWVEYIGYSPTTEQIVEKPQQ
jgi:hypothetical protein